MNKGVVAILIAAVVLVGLAIGVRNAESGDMLYGLKSLLSTRVAYVADVEEDIETIESEMAHASAMIEGGTLSEDEAFELRSKLVSRLQSVQSTMARAETNTSLTPAQLESLKGSLTRLAAALTTYRDSLLKLDTLAANSSKSKKYANGRSQNVAKDSEPLALESIIVDTIQVVEEHIEEVSGEEVSEEVIEDIIEVVETAEDVAEEESTLPEEELGEGYPATDEGVTEASTTEGGETEDPVEDEVSPEETGTDDGSTTPEYETN